MQDRDDAVDEQLELLVRAEGEVDAVEGVGMEPCLDRVGDGLRCAHERRVLEVRRGVDHLAQREVVPSCPLNDLRGAGAPALLGQMSHVRERRVGVVLAEVVRAEAASEQREVAREVVVLLGGLAFASARAVVGGRDDRTTVDEHLDMVGVASCLCGPSLDVPVVLTR